MFTPQMYDRLERAELAADIARMRAVGNPFVFVDIGANVGFYSMFVATLAGPEARIIAVEPDPTNFNRFRFNLAANPGLSIHAVALAMGEEAGELLIMPNREDRGGTRTRKPDQTATKINQVRVPCRPITDFLAEEGLTAIDALKIDVEGFEPAVLVPFFRDAPATLWPRLILIEDSSEEWPVDVIALLTSNGYRVRARSRHNVILHRGAEPSQVGAG